MAKFRVRYRRGGREPDFETIVEVNAYTRNQAMLKLQEERKNYKDLNYSDVEILDVQKYEGY